LFGTGNGQLIELDAKTGTLVPSFGDKGIVDLRAGIADGYPKANYAISSPPVIYRDVVIVGPSTQESGSVGPSGEPRRFHSNRRRPGVYRRHHKLQVSGFRCPYR
jgi:glucose dehydrogenase